MSLEEANPANCAHSRVTRRPTYSMAGLAIGEYWKCDQCPREFDPREIRADVHPSADATELAKTLHDRLAQHDPMCPSTNGHPCDCVEDRARNVDHLGFALDAFHEQRLGRLAEAVEDTPSNSLVPVSRAEMRLLAALNRSLAKERTGSMRVADWSGSTHSEDTARHWFVAGFKAGERTEEEPKPIFTRSVPTAELDESGAYILSMKSTMDAFALQVAAAEDGMIRRELIKLGWTPPPASAPRAGREA